MYNGASYTVYFAVLVATFKHNSMNTRSLLRRHNVQLYMLLCLRVATNTAEYWSLIIFTYCFHIYVVKISFSLLYTILSLFFTQLDLQLKTMQDVEDKLEQAKHELQAAKDQATLLDKKYNKAKKLIKEFQQRYIVQ